MLVGFGVVLLVAGAVLSFAVDVGIDSVDRVTIGWLLMVVGATSILVGAVRGAMSNATGRIERRPQGTTGGRDLLEDSRDD